MPDENQVNQNSGDQGNNQQQQATQSLGWRAALPDEYKEHEFVKTFDKPGDFVKTAIEIKTERDGLNDKLGKAIFKPDENATDEQKAAYKLAMGIPDTPDAYELDKPNLPEGFEYNTDMEKWYRETAHKLGLPKDTAKALFGEYNGMVQAIGKAQIEQAEKVRSEGMEKLKTEWKNEYDGNVAIVKRVQEKIGIDAETKQWITDHNAENDPVLIKLLLKVAPAFLNDTIPASTSTSTDNRSLDDRAKDFYKT
jgi:hypothetical protein